MSADRANALFGNKSEKDLCSLLKRKPEVAEILREKLGISGRRFLEVFPTGPSNRKSDLVAMYENALPLGINVKSARPKPGSPSTGFNQVTRMWLESFSEKMLLSEDSKHIIQHGIDNHRLRRSKMLIEERFRERLSSELDCKRFEVMEEIFRGTGNDVAKCLAIYNQTIGTFYFYNIEDVILSLAEQRISYSNNGVIRFGPYITLQRKGGDGNVKTYPKSDNKHPGNQIQFKMKILSFVESEPPLLTHGLAY
jgi:hypothetical protein